MIRNVVLVVAAALLLAGCVLQAKPPFFKEEDGVTVLGNKTISFDGYEVRDGTWTKSNGSDPPLQFAPAGHHYIITEPGNTDSKTDSVTALFVPLEDGWLALQLTEFEKPPIYSLAKLDGHDLLVAPIMCSDLKTQDSAKSAVEFDGNDCTATSVTNARSFLLALAAALPAPKMKLVPVR